MQHGHMQIQSAVCRCLKVTDRGFSSVAKWCKGLQELRMYACSALTDQTLTKLGTSVSDLKGVGLLWC